MRSYSLLLLRLLVFFLSLMVYIWTVSSVLNMTKVHLFCFTEVVKGDGKEIPDVVKRWVEDYERNKKSATAELLSMLFEVVINAFLSDFVTCIGSLLYYDEQACGAKYHLQEEDIDETDVDDVVVALVNMARRVSFAL